MIAPVRLNDQNKIMQIQFQSSMMKISYDRELQETLFLTKDKRSRIELRKKDD